MNQLRWSDDIKKLERNNRVVLANAETGNWLKISKNCIEILDDSVKMGLSGNEIIQSFEDEEDKLYIKTLISKLTELEAWKIEDKKKKTLQQVYFMLTHRCNLHCIHCSMNASYSNSEEYLNTDKVIEALETVIKLEPKQIVLSGGEPLVRKDFFQILDYLSSKYKGEITLMTNGVLINEENVDTLISKVSSIDISIDGINEETCSKVRGKGIFQKVIDNIVLLQERGFHKISLSMVFGNSNYYMLPEFYEMNRNLGTKPIPRAFSPIGRGEESVNYFNKLSPQQLKEFNQKDMQETLKACNCKACRNEICIDFNGDIYPCALLVKEKYKLGNMFNTVEVNNIFDENKLTKIPAYQEFEKLYPDKIKHCQKCDLNIFCWSCLHFVDIYLDSENFEERCKAKKEGLEKLVWDME